jgi:ganglioside-induced differentiation-associated protein 1
MLELYHHGGSVCAAKVRLTLAEKGLEWKGHWVDIMAGDQFRPEYLKLNPRAVVPTLIHDGKVIRESTIICEYLDEVFPNPPLRPADPAARAQMRLWTKRPDESIHHSCTTVTFSMFARFTLLKMKPDAVNMMPAKELETHARKTVNPDVYRRKERWLLDGLNAPDVKDALRAFDGMLGDMETALAGGGPWLLGNQYTLADIGLTPYVNRLDVLSLSGMWTESRPHVGEWFARIKARPNFGPGVGDWIRSEDASAMRSVGAGSWPRVKAMLQAA